MLATYQVPDTSSCSHPETDGDVRGPDRIDVDSLQRDDAARGLVLVLGRAEVVQHRVVEHEPVLLPLPHVPCQTRAKGERRHRTTGEKETGRETTGGGAGATRGGVGAAGGQPISSQRKQS